MAVMDSRARVASRLYRAAAISNFLVTVPTFVWYRRYVAKFAKEPPDYPFLVWIWNGMAFLWGVAFLEISRDPVGKYPLVKYSYLEKGVTATSVTVAYLTGNVPRRLFVTILFTDVAWIPCFVAAQRILRNSTTG